MSPSSEPPFFSIVTPSYNQARYLPETLASVRAQQGAGFEHLIFDNNSTDGTDVLLKEYAAANSGVTVTVGPDAGQADAINKGWQRSRGEWLAWLNADDLYEPGALARVRAEIETHPEARWIVGEFRIINEAGCRVGWLHSAYKNALLKRYSYNLLLSENIIPQMSVFIRADLWKEAGPLRVDDPTTFDYEYWLRLGKLARPHVISQTLSVFRYHENSKTGLNLKAQFSRELDYAREHAGGARWPILLHRLNFHKTLLFYRLVKRF